MEEKSLLWQYGADILTAPGMDAERGIMQHGQTSCFAHSVAVAYVSLLLARRLHRPFVDLDEFIEQQTGQTVAEIFNTRGEGAFRALEREAARSLCSQSGLVLSCGGGTVLNPQTAALLKQSGTVIYLKVLPQTVLQRLKGDRTRPLLQGTEAEKKNRITALLAEREPFYTAAAEFTVSTNQGPEQAVLDILNQTGLI